MTPKKPVRVVSPVQFRNAVQTTQQPVKKSCNCGKNKHK